MSAFNADPTPQTDDNELMLWRKIGLLMQRMSASEAAPPVPGLGIPPYDSMTMTYVGGGGADDDKVQTVVYKSGEVTVATLTITYIGATNNIETITKS